MQHLYPNQYQALTEIITRTRLGEESFLFDNGMIARNVIEYLHNQGMLRGKVVKLEVKENEKVENY